MGLFIFLIIMLAAAWGFVAQLDALPPPPPPPRTPVTQHALPAAKPVVTDQTVSDDPGTVGNAPIHEVPSAGSDAKSS